MTQIHMLFASIVNDALSRLSRLAQSCQSSWIRNEYCSAGGADNEHSLVLSPGPSIGWLKKGGERAGLQNQQLDRQCCLDLGVPPQLQIPPSYPAWYSVH